VSEAQETRHAAARRVWDPGDDPAEWRAAVDEFVRSLNCTPGELFYRAFTHRTWSDLTGDPDNERLELLGDSVLALIVVEELITRYPDLGEGALTQRKQRLVCEDALADAARRLGLGGLLRASPGERRSGAHDRSSALSDTFEALLAAIYLDHGLESARRFVSEHLMAHHDPDAVHDYKSRFQELIQERLGVTPTYRITECTGPAHEPWFASEVVVEETPWGRGEGRRRKAAEQEAARRALERLNESAAD
jgi:ribonuclease-3